MNKAPLTDFERKILRQLPRLSTGMIRALLTHPRLTLADQVKGTLQTHLEKLEALLRVHTTKS
jgi:hypothetical protein